MNSKLILERKLVCFTKKLVVQKTLKPLSELEERLMALLSKIVITGAPDIPEGGIIEDMANRELILTL
jgi:hypothetical protein